MEASGFQIDSQFLAEKEAESITQRTEHMERFKQWVVGQTQDENSKLINFQSKRQLAYLFFGDELDEVVVQVPAAQRKVNGVVDANVQKQFLLPV